MARQRIAARGARFWLRLIAGAALSFTPWLAAMAADEFAARLSPVPIDPVIAATTTGSGKAAAVLDGAKLSLTGEFAGLKGEATVARVHEGRAVGVRGPAVADFTVPSAASGSFTAELTLTPQQAESLKQGRLYLQIHSAAAPDGNLWGWLLSE